MYNEALTLVNAYDFLDIISDRERFGKYGKVWRYGVKSRERNVDGDYGISIYGALEGCVSAEPQFLAKNLDYYVRGENQKTEGKLCHDALSAVLYGFDELDEYKDYEQCVFGNKTQGYAHHNYLLAIALLLEDRLGKAFTVSGDITYGQIKYAVEWAN